MSPKINFVPIDGYALVEEVESDQKEVLHLGWDETFIIEVGPDVALAWAEQVVWLWFEFIVDPDYLEQWYRDHDDEDS